MKFTASRRCLLSGAMLLGLLGGCAVNPALHQAQTSFDEGRVEESLATLQGAIKAAPTRADLRAAYLSLRDRAITGWLKSAHDAARDGHAEQARSWYQRILKLDPDNDRAKLGLRELDAEARHTAWLDEARRFVAQKDNDAAIAALRRILAEDPGEDAARTLLGSLETGNEAPTPYPRLAAALRKTLSIEFKAATLKQVFEVFSRTSGVNFVFDRDVPTDQPVTIFLHESSVKKAIDVVLMTNQLEQRVLDANTILIYPDTPAKLKAYQDLTVRTFFLMHADPEQIANTIKSILGTRNIVVDKKQNTVTMRDTPETVSAAEKLVQLQDLPDPEVMLEVEILEVDRNNLVALGIQYPDQLTLTPLASVASGAVTLADLGRLTTSRVGANVTPLTVNASQTTTNADLLANPRIRVRNRETARILIGDKVPTITSTATATGFVFSNVQYLDVGLKLEVTPVISRDNEVSIKINLEVSNIANQVTTSQGTVAYQIGTRSASTVLQLKDGENQVLAGLINDNDRRTANKIPGLGDIPLLGRLFSNHQNDREKTEIVLSITPRIIRNALSPEARLLEFDSGTVSDAWATDTTGGSAAAPAMMAPGNPPANPPGNPLANPPASPPDNARPAYPAAPATSHVR